MPVDTSKVALKPLSREIPMHREISGLKILEVVAAKKCCTVP
jgi:hypothetical protein